MILPSEPPVPILVLLSLLLASVPTSASPTPTRQPAPLPTPAVSPPSGLSLPLYQRHDSHLVRRAQPDTVRSWALREKGRIRGKYGVEDVGAVIAELDLNKRQVATTRLSVAASNTETGAPDSTASGSASGTRTASANSSMPTTPVGAVEVLNFEADLAYFAPVSVGVPAQEMNLILDTGSADLWMASSSCTPDTGCSNITLYNSTLSTTSVDLNTSFSVRYGSGSASGDLRQDYVSFAGFNVSSQTFAVADVVSTDLISGSLSGLMGLGWQPLAASGVTPWWENLFRAGVLPFPGFAFALTRFVNISSADAVEPGGLLTIGYLNMTLYQGDINYVDIPSGMESYWVIPMNAVGVNGTNVTESEVYAAIDTGTTLIGGPQDVVSDLYSRIEGAQAATGPYQGYYSYPCATDVNVTLSFGGISYNVSSDDFNLGPFGVTNNVSTCLGALFDLSLSSSSRISWVIGAAFLKNVYSVFRADPPAVGFANLATGNRSAAIYNQTQSVNGTTDENSTRNGSYAQIPNGIYGPSGGISMKTSIMAEQVTTAIEAGQTISAGNLPSAARRMAPSLLLGAALVFGGWTLT